MGNFYTERDAPSSTADQYNAARRGDWFLGFREDNFSFSVRWYERDEINGNKTSRIPRVELRRWCERNLNGDTLALSYFHQEFRSNKNLFENGHFVYESYVEFFFEFEEDMVAFKLRWEQCVSSN